MPQLRQDPIAGYWVAISPKRSERPIDFARVTARSRSAAQCPFCPGHEHLTPPELSRIPDGLGGWRLRVFPNKYPALSESDGGAHEVIVESPLHVATFGELPEQASRDLLASARGRFEALLARAGIEYIQLFKNNGAGSGASLEHPHSQLLAMPKVPLQIGLEWEGARRAASAAEGCFYCGMFADAAAEGRVIYEDGEALALAPYAPRLAYETWIVPRRHASHFEHATAASTESVAALLHRVLRRLEELFDYPPYNFFLHTAPLRQPACAFYHWHIEILPRVGGVGGFEFGCGSYINAVPPEDAAEHMRK